MKKDPIDHVVVMMFENHSFDQMLGAVKAVRPEIDGVDPSRPGVNRDSAGRAYVQKPTSSEQIADDPKHEVEHVALQISENMSGFVSDFEAAYPDASPEELQQIMDYFQLGQLQALHSLAQSFLVCDRWFSSVPGPTWANRFFVHSGTSRGRVKMPETAGDFALDPSVFWNYDQDTIYDRLNERGISWRIYAGDIAQSLVLQHQWSNPRNAWRYCGMERFFADAHGPAAKYPQYTFIEPTYYMGGDFGQNDDHPPHSVRHAQALLAQVYNALRANEELWYSTLLIVVYDEHGGFYDHVFPPNAVPPDDDHSEYLFNRLGVRVPAILVSPWVDAGVNSAEFDHTSILRYLIDKWSLDALTRRVDMAQSFATAIRVTGSPRSDCPPSLHVNLPVMAAPPGVTAPMLPLNEHQKAMVAFSNFLESQTPRAVVGPPPSHVRTWPGGCNYSHICRGNNAIESAAGSRS